MAEKNHTVTICPKCRRQVGLADNFCRHCGFRLSGVEWYYNKLFVILLLFLVTGALGLPLLIRSPEFTAKEKIVLSIIVVLYTAAMLLGFALFMVWIWNWGFSQLG